MKFRYLGKKETMIAFGHDFSGGAVCDVTDANAIKRLTGNSHFAAVVDKKAAEPKKAPAAGSAQEPGKPADAATATDDDPNQGTLGV